MPVIVDMIEHVRMQRSVGPTVPAETMSALAEAAEHADADGHPHRDAVTALRRSGLLGMAVPTGYAGPGGDAAALNRCVEQVATVNASAAIILFQHFAVTARISECGSEHQKREILPRLASGEWIAASAWSETGAGANKRRLTSTGRRDTEGGGWVLDGAKSFTTGAGLADIYLVLVQTSAPDGPDDSAYGAEGQTFFLVRGTNPALVPDVSLDLVGMRGSATGFVTLRRCRVDDADRLGPLGAAPGIIAGVRETGATLGAVSVGLAQAALDVAVDHTRRCGTVDMQAVRHRLVDLGTQVEAARAIVVRAGHRSSAAPGITTLQAKLFASTVAEQVCAQVQQLLGSIGYVKDHPVNRYGRDARAVALMGPTNDLCRELVGAAWTR